MEALQLVRDDYLFLMLPQSMVVSCHCIKNTFSRFPSSLLQCPSGFRNSEGNLSESIPFFQPKNSLKFSSFHIRYEYRANGSPTFTQQRPGQRKPSVQHDHHGAKPPPAILTSASATRTESWSLGLATRWRAALLCRVVRNYPVTPSPRPLVCWLVCCWFAGCTVPATACWSKATTDRWAQTCHPPWRPKPAAILLWTTTTSAGVPMTQQSSAQWSAVSRALLLDRVAIPPRPL